MAMFPCRKWRAVLDVKMTAVIDTNQKWNISVICSDVTTYMEQLSLAMEEDWTKQLRVRFLGEDGIDLGGLTKEFFSTLFKKIPLLKGPAFSVSASALIAVEYKPFGRAVAYGLLVGQPPWTKMPDPIFSQYILEKKAPGLSGL